MTRQRIKPPPPAFAETFVRHGWRGIETAFGARNQVHRRWIDECGGDALFAARQEYRRNLSRLRAAQQKVSSRCRA
jgi:hypothetical protein